MTKPSLLLFFFLSIIQPCFSQVEDAVTTISINATSGLQFDIVRFQVKPEQNVKLVLTNTDDMSHNMLITKPGARLDVVNAALQLEEKGPLLDYTPKSSLILWSIPVLSPGQTKSISFKAPKETGVYPYVCTYPGHGFVMYGAMYVSNEKMPDLKTDINIPPSHRQDIIADNKNTELHKSHQAEASIPQALHPYPTVPPYLYRVFLEDASPAAIAVNLTKDLSYCWDASTCRLRYAWTGGFVDNSALWKGHADAVAKVMGTIFYRDKTAYPILIGKHDDIPKVDYKGYRLINRFPEFHYTLNGIEVFELILPKEDGKGLIRRFKIPYAGKTIWFDSNSGDATAHYEASAGTWENGKLRLSSQQAHEFSITMTNYSLYNTRKRK